MIETSNAFERQRTLLPQGFTTQAPVRSGQQALRTAQAQLDKAQADLLIAKDRVSYTELKAGVVGSITARTAEAGEVVQPGQTVFQVARQDGRDAVFDVPAQVLRSAPPIPRWWSSLVDDPAVTAEGRVRQVDPQADPITRTFRVRVGLINPPPAMLLGATVRGRMDLRGDRRHLLACKRLRAHQRAAGGVARRSGEHDRRPAHRGVEIGRFDPSTVLVSRGLEGRRDRRHRRRASAPPGQKVRLLGAAR